MLQLMSVPIEIIKEALIEGFQYFLQKFQYTTKVSEMKEIYMY